LLSSGWMGSWCWTVDLQPVFWGVSGFWGFGVFSNNFSFLTNNWRQLSYYLYRLWGWRFWWESG
jgi:hypothetical protein